MQIDIVVRAQDPAAAAAALSALGIRLRKPDRPNPGRWHGWGRVSVSVEPCAADDAPTLALGVRDLERVAAVLPSSEQIGKGAILINVSGAKLTVFEHAGPVRRPGGDEGMLLQAGVVLRDAGPELSEAFARLGATNGRLIGPELLHGRFERRFSLVLDRASATALTEINSILARHSDPTMAVEAVAAEALDAATLAGVDRLAWDWMP